MLENNGIDCLQAVADDAVDVLRLEFPSLYGEVIKIHEVDADNEELASSKVKDACTKLLCNQIMENFTFELQEVS